MRFCLQITLVPAVLAAAAMAGLGAEQTLAPPAGSPAPKVMSIVRVDSRTGRLIRTIVVSGKPEKTPAANSEIRAWIEETAKNLEVSPELVDSVIQVESNYDSWAVSPKGAQGLMQLMPATARRFGVTNTFDPRQNIEGGIRYLKLLQQTYQDNRLALAAYNAGETAVAKYGGVPPYPETVNYVAKVGRKYGQAQQKAAKHNAEAKSTPEKPAPSSGEPRHVAGYIDADGRLHIAMR